MLECSFCKSVPTLPQDLVNLWIILCSIATDDVSNDGHLMRVFDFYSLCVMRKDIDFKIVLNLV